MLQAEAVVAECPSRSHSPSNQGRHLKQMGLEFKSERSMDGLDEAQFLKLPASFQKLNDITSFRYMLVLIVHHKEQAKFISVLNIFKQAKCNAFPTRYRCVVRRTKVLMWTLRPLYTSTYSLACFARSEGYLLTESV